MNDLDHAIARAMTASVQLPAAKRSQVDAAIAGLVLLNGSSSEYDVVHPTKLREQLGFLLNSLEGAYEKPTALELSTYQDLNAMALDGEARLAALTSAK
jgi:hypothetical protein